jgi:hypothetical protein
MKSIQVQSVRRTGNPIAGVYAFEELIERHHNLDGGII